MNAVLHAAIGKRALEAVAAGPSGFRRRKSAVDLRGALLRLHLHRGEIVVRAADDAAGEIVFQLADGNRPADAHIRAFAAGGIERKTARDLEVRAGGLVGKQRDEAVRGHGVIDHQGMDVLHSFIVIHHARAGDARAAAAVAARSHARSDLNADLGSLVREIRYLIDLGIAQQGIHVPGGAVHGEGAADAHLGRGAVLHSILGARAAEGDGAEEIRGGKVNGAYAVVPVFHRHVIQHGVGPATQERQGHAALDADGGSCAARSGRGSRRRSVRIRRLAGLAGRARGVRSRALVLGGLRVVFQILGVLLGFVRA